MDIGTYGVWTSYHSIAKEDAGEAAALAEKLGFGTFWLGGSPRLPEVRPLLEATESLTVATGIVNIWAYDPAELAAEYAALSADFPGRLLLGIGIGHPEATKEYEKPLAMTRHFLDGLSGAETPVARQDMCLAALGPKMLDLSYERTLGTHPYFVPPEHTAFARERLGSGAMVAPELAVVLGTEREAARAAARKYAKLYLGLQNYTNNLLKFGFTEADIADGGSDRLIDTIVPQGDAVTLAAEARKHIDAGAGHVCLQTVGVQGVPTAEWSALAAELIG